MEHCGNEHPHHAHGWPADEPGRVDHCPGTGPIDITAHFAERRRKTLAAIRRGLLPDDEDYDAPNALADRLAERVLAELEAMWHEDEVFT